MSATPRSNSVGGDDQKKPLTDGTGKVSGLASKGFDKLEISGEAMRMQAESLTGTTPTIKGSEAETQRIKNNIASGFYNSPSVQRAVAMKINKMIPGVES